jgi:hypothetical protein
MIRRTLANGSNSWSFIGAMGSPGVDSFNFKASEINSATPFTTHAYIKPLIKT